MGLLEDARQELDRRRGGGFFNSILKNQLLNVPPGPTGDVADLDDKTFPVFDMTMNGIQVAETIHDALNLTQSMRLVSDVCRDTQVVSAALKDAARFAFALETLGPLAGYVGFWIDSADGWAEAKARILKDNAARGLSNGVVLGANGVDSSYVAGNFWQQANGSYPTFREVEAAARNMHNTALVAGYAHGKSLTRTQKARFFAYLHGRMRDTDRAYFFGVAVKDWGPRMKKDYYVACAALFRKHNLDS